MGEDESPELPVDPLRGLAAKDGPAPSEVAGRARSRLLSWPVSASTCRTRSTGYDAAGSVTLSTSESRTPPGSEASALGIGLHLHSRAVARMEYTANQRQTNSIGFRAADGGPFASGGTGNGDHLRTTRIREERRAVNRRGPRTGATARAALGAPPAVRPSSAVGSQGGRACRRLRSARPSNLARPRRAVDRGPGPLNCRVAFGPQGQDSACLCAN